MATRALAGAVLLRGLCLCLCQCLRLPSPNFASPAADSVSREVGLNLAVATMRQGEVAELQVGYVGAEPTQRMLSLPRCLCLPRAFFFFC